MSWYPKDNVANKIITRRMLITPQIAEQMLKLNKGNRPIVQRRVDNFAKLILAGKFFQDFYEGIGFCGDRLIDGQHRLKGVIQSGKSIVMRISYNVPSEQLSAINRAKTRTDADSATIANRGDIDKLRISIINIMSASYGGTASALLDVDEKIMFYDLHATAIEFAIDHLLDGDNSGTSRKLISPQLLATVAKAYYFAEANQKKGRLREFCAQYRNGPTDSRIRDLQRRLTDMLGRSAEGRKDRANKSRMISWTLEKFLNDIPALRSNLAKTDPFPLPESAIA